MIAYPDPEKQPRTPTRSTDADHPPRPSGPPTPACPYCGRAAMPYDPRLSAVLDLVDELDQALRLVKRAAEEVSL